MPIQPRQSGNVLFLIFIAIGLFAALTYVVSDGTRGNTRMISDGKAKALTSEVLSYGQDLKNAVNYLVSANGCSENEISFQSTGWANATFYENPNSPTNGRCHVFDQRGAGVTWRLIGDLYSNGTEYGYPIIGTNGPTENSIRGFGRDQLADLYFSIRSRDTTAKYGANLAVCKQINRQMGIPEHPAGAFENLRPFYRGSLTSYYNGAFYDTTIPSLNGSYFANFSAFCAEDTVGYIRIIIPIYVR